MHTLKADYDDLTAEYRANADAHDEASKRILFNILQQAAAVDGLTKTEGDALTAIAQSWGLVDQSTVDAYTAAQDWFAGLHDGVGVSLVDLAKLYQKMNGLENKTITIDIWEKTHKFVDYTSGKPSGKAHGGPVTSGVPYIVGEAGPEIFMPNVAGRIIPNNQIYNTIQQPELQPDHQRRGQPWQRGDGL